MDDMQLLTPEEAQARLEEMMRSPDWWVIESQCHLGDDRIVEIETTYYPPGTPRNADFIMMLRSSPGPRISAVYFAKKKWMTAKQLAQIVQVGWEALESRDIVLLVNKVTK